MSSISPHGTAPPDLRDKVLEENRKVHARENRLYLARHPEQTNFFQSQILEKTIARVCDSLGPAPAHILDLGCGTGYLYLKFLSRGYRMTGVDLSEEMIGALEEQVPAEARARSNLVVAGAEDFVEQTTERFDVVVLSAFLHHLFDYESVVRGACKNLCPGGLFLVFFEPLKQKIDSPFRYAVHRGISRLDEQVYRLDMKIRGIPLFEEDYRLSDYQRQFGGIDPLCLMDILRSEKLDILDVEKYCARRYGFPALIATHLLGAQNTFNLIARRVVSG